jgi:membrane protein
MNHSPTPIKLWPLAKTTFEEWNQDNAARLAAALAYYTVFSLAPLLIIAIAIAGLALGQEAAQGRIVAQLRGLLGQQGAELVQGMIESANKPSVGLLATVIGLITLLFGATGVFGELQSALNTIWNIQPKPQNGVLAFLQTRFWSLMMVLGIGFLLLVSLILSAILTGISTWVQGYIGEIAFIAQIINVVLGFGVSMVLLALIYKVLPDLKIAWRDVWVGAAITALLFGIGRLLIGLYLVECQSKKSKLR